MDKKTSSLLLSIASGGLLVGALILLVVQIFSETKDNFMLGMALFAIVLAYIFNGVRTNLNKNDK